MEQSQIIDDLSVLLKILPPTIAESILEEDNNGDLLEVVLDLGRVPTARYLQDEIILGDDVSSADIEAVCSQISTFDDDNRAGIERTLHRISAIRNRKQVTCSLLSYK